MFMGEYAHMIDVKGRVILPADFRRDLGDTFILTRGLEPCLYLYGQETWEQVTQKLLALPVLRTEARAVARFLFSGARRIECDKQGRVLIPAGLRSHAGIVPRQDVVLAGAGNHIEVWNGSQWLTYKNDTTPHLADLASAVADCVSN